MTTTRNPGGRVMAILAACMCVTAFICFALPFVSVSLYYYSREFTGFELLDRGESALLVLSLLCVVAGIAFGFIGIKVRKIAIGGIITSAFALIFMFAYFIDGIEYMGAGAVLNLLLDIVALVFFIVSLAKPDIEEETYDPRTEKICMACGNAIDINATFCRHCGNSAAYAPVPPVAPVVPQVEYCRSCGAQLAPGTAFCANCGAPRT